MLSVRSGSDQSRRFFSMRTDGLTRAFARTKFNQLAKQKQRTITRRLRNRPRHGHLSAEPLWEKYTRRQHSTML